LIASMHFFVPTKEKSECTMSNLLTSFCAVKFALVSHRLIKEITHDKHMNVKSI